jgi:hypothetical protein
MAGQTASRARARLIVVAGRAVDVLGYAYGERRQYALVLGACWSWSGLPPISVAVLRFGVIGAQI